MKQQQSSLIAGILFSSFLLAIAGCTPSAPTQTPLRENLAAVSTIVVSRVSSTPPPPSAAQTPSATRMITPTITPVQTPTTTPTLTNAPTLPPSPTHTPLSSPTFSPLRKIGELPLPGFSSPSFGMSNDGSLLAISAAGQENTLYVYDMTSQTMKWQFDDDSGELTGYSSLTFSSDGHYLAGWDNGFSLFVWDMANGEVIHQISFHRDDEVSARSISISPDGQLLALSSFNSPVLLYSMATGELVDRFPSPNITTYPLPDTGNYFLRPGGRIGGDIWQIGFVPGHARLLAITVYPYPPFAEGEGVTGGLFFWNMQAQSLESLITGEAGLDFVISPNGLLLVTRIDRQLIGWDIPNNRKAFTITNVEDSTDLDSITDIGYFTTRSSREELRIWNFTGELVAAFDFNPDKRVSDTIFTPDGHMLLSYYGDDKQPIEIWEINE